MTCDHITRLRTKRDAEANAAVARIAADEALSAAISAGAGPGYISVLTALFNLRWEQWKQAEEAKQAELERVVA